MCFGCWRESGYPDYVTSETGRLVELIKRLYELPGCDNGGPLHSVLDDWNVRAEGDPKIQVWHGRSGYSPEIYEVCDEIAAIMNQMTEDEQLSALAKWEGFVRPGSGAE